MSDILHDSTRQPPNRATKAGREILAPAICLVAVSTLHFFFGLFYCVFTVYSDTVAQRHADAAHMNHVYALYVGITMFYALLVFTGGISMLRRSSYMWAMTICILATIPILGPCYFLAIPFGIWGILVLKRPAVRDAFRII